VHLKAYADGRDARAGIGSWMTFYNFRRPHQAMNNQMPMAVWRDGMNKLKSRRRPELWICRFAWTTQTR
jgi:putative transposase